MMSEEFVEIPKLDEAMRVSQAPIFNFRHQRVTNGSISDVVRPVNESRKVLGRANAP